MNEILVLVTIYLIVLNGMGFISMYQDKQYAIKQKRRIPEKRLFTIAIAGGSVGAFVAMRVFRHKTKHQSFSLGLPLLMLLHLGILLIILYYIQA